MIAEITKVVLAGNVKKALTFLNVLLWITLISSTYSKWIEPFDFNSLKEFNAVIEMIFFGGLIKLGAWTLCVLICYYSIRFFLVKYLVQSQKTLRWFLQFIRPHSLKILIANVIYKRQEVFVTQLSRTKAFRHSIYSEMIKLNLISLKLLIGINLKFIILLIVGISAYQGLLFWVAICSLFIAIVLLLIGLLAMINSIWIMRLKKLMGEIALIWSKNIY